MYTGAPPGVKRCRCFSRRSRAVRRARRGVRRERESVRIRAGRPRQRAQRLPRPFRRSEPHGRTAGDRDFVGEVRGRRRDLQLRRLRTGTHAPPRSRAVGYVTQDDSLFPHLSTLGNLWYGARRRGAGGAALEESRSSTFSDSRHSSTGARPLFRAARGAAWPSAARCCRGPSSYFWTNRFPDEKRAKRWERRAETTA
jgi:hypothetical protein